MTNPTIYDVARHAGVGIGTVSRVLNNSPKVTPATRKLVLDAIAELDYRPNRVARLLPRKSRVHNIGVITQPFVHYWSFAERLRGVQMALQTNASQYEVVLYNVSSLDHFQERLETITHGGVVEGLIIIDLDLLDSQLTLLQDASLPFVGLNHFRNREWLCFGTDNAAAGALAANFLLGLGHTHLAYIGDDFINPFRFSTSQERFKGYWQTLKQQGIVLPRAHIKLGPHEYQVAKMLALELLTQTAPNRPTAIFAMSDMQALAAIDAARKLGLRVPEDLSVIGHDDLQMSYHAGLTTIRQHLELTGILGMETLLNMMDGDSPEPSVLPPLEVIERNTTRRME